MPKAWLPHEPAREAMPMTTRAQKIQEYIKNPNAKKKGVVRIELEGQRKELEVYSLPWEFLVFNVKNGRLAKEVLMYERLNNVQLDPESDKDALTIRDMLLQQEPAATTYLKEDISRVGQLEPGIITHDGIVINANRRFAVLQTLFDETKDQKYRYMEVAILPPHVPPRDLWMIEAGLQLSRDPRLSYGPINARLKLREGVDSGLSAAEVALAMGQGLKEGDVKERLEELDLIDEYLDFFNIPYEYAKAEDKMNHFIDLRSILARADDENLDDDEKFDLRVICFHFINQNVVTHRELREVRKILQSEEARKILRGALATPATGPNPTPSGTSTPTAPSPGAPPSAAPVASGGDPVVPPASAGPSNPSTPASAAPTGLAPTPSVNPAPAKVELKDSFERARDVAAAKADAARPAKLAQKALDNLEAIPPDSSNLGESQVVEILSAIKKKTEDLLQRGTQ